MEDGAKAVGATEGGGPIKIAVCGLNQGSERLLAIWAGEIDQHRIVASGSYLENRAELSGAAVFRRPVKIAVTALEEPVVGAIARVTGAADKAMQSLSPLRLG